MTVTRRTMFRAGAAALAAAAVPAAVPPARAAAPASGKQAPGFYRFKIGDFEVTQLHDGVATSPLPDTFVRNVPKPELQKALQDLFLPGETWTNTFTPLVVNTGAKLVLFDTGFGNNGAGTVGNLAANMASAGIDPKTIDTVVISHFHPDHINGLRSKDGEPVYPNAEVMVPEKEWAFWMDDARMNSAPEGMRGVFQVVRRVFGPMAKDVRPFAWGRELAPGISAVDANGHTPGHTAFTIASGQGHMLYVADITNNPLVFARNPEWKLMFDMDADAAVATRKRLLDMAAAERLRVSFYHAAFPATGHVARTASGYDFVPTFWSSAT